MRVRNEPALAGELEPRLPLRSHSTRKAHRAQDRAGCERAPKSLYRSVLRVCSLLKRVFFLPSGGGLFFAAPPPTASPTRALERHAGSCHRFSSHLIGVPNAERERERERNLSLLSDPSASQRLSLAIRIRSTSVQLNAEKCAPFLRAPLIMLSFVLRAGAILAASRRRPNALLATMNLRPVPIAPPGRETAPRLSTEWHRGAYLSTD